MMPSSGDDVSGKSRSLQRVIFFTGLALYMLSFFLPVFRDTVGSKSIPGWRCAYVALFLWVVDLGPKTIPWLNVGYRLGGFGGIVNPIAVAYLVLRLLDLARKTQRVLAALILLCILLTWVSLIILCLQDATCPGVGHAVWVGGLLLMISASFSK
jgi:hypothetical protein